MADDGTVRIGLEIDSSKAKTQAKKEATDTGKQIGNNVSSEVQNATDGVGEKVGTNISEGIKNSTDGTYRDAAGRLRNSSGQFVSAGTSAGEAAGSGIRTGVLSKLSGITDDLGSIGSTMSLAITAPILAIGTASFKTSMDFDTSMSQLAGALNEPIDSIGSLRQLAIQTGQDTIYSASEAGSAMIELAKGGLTEAQIEGGALASTMQLASAGNIQLADSANTVVRAMGAFHLSAADTESAVNALAGSANASSADVSDVSMALSQASAQAYSAGWSIQDTTAAIAELADSGIKGSDAGTSLKTMLQSLQAPTDTAAKVIQQLGLQVRDADGNMRPATEIVGELQTKLGGLSSAQRDAALQTIFGSDASRAALVLMNGGVDTYEKYTEATNDQTAAQRMADAQMGSSQKAIENAKGAIETAAISLGGALSPAVEHAADVVGDLASNFANLSDGQKDTIIKFALFAAAIGPVAKGISSVSNFAKTASDAINKLGGENTKLISASNLAKGAVAGLAIAGIAILASELIKAKERGDEFNKITLGMEDAANKSSSALQLQSSNLSTTGSSAKQAAFDLDAFLQKQSGYVDSINSTNSAAASNIAQLSQAKAVIDEYAGKTDLSTDAQNALRAAIEQVNSQCGTQLTVTDAANGVVYDSATSATVAKDAIDKYIESKIQQIRVDALTQDLTNAYSAQQAAIDAVTSAQADYNAKKAEYLAIQEAANSGDEMEISSLGAAYQAYQTASKNLDTAKGSYDSSTAAVQSFNTQLGISAQASTDTSNTYANFIAAHAQIASAVDYTGNSLTNFQNDLASTGASTELLNSLSSDQLTELGLKYDGTIGSITARLWEFAGSTEGPGADAAVKWKGGFDANTQGMIDAATSASGLTLEQFQLLAGEAGISGQDAIASLAASLSDPNADAAGATQKLMDAVALKLTGGDIKAASALVGHNVSDGLAAGIDENAPDAKQKSLEMANAVIEQARTALDVHSPSVVFHDIGLNLGQGLADGINEGSDIAAAAADSLSKLSADHFSSASVDAWYAGNNMAGDSFAGGVSGGGDSAAGASDYISKLAADHMSSANSDAWWAGYNMAQGMADGISNNAISVVTASEVMASDAVKAAKEKLDEHSPSKAMRQVGGFFSQGMALGINDDASLAVEAARGMAFDAMSAAIITSGFSPLQDLGFAMSGSAAVNYSMMYNQSMADSGTYAALNDLAQRFDRLADSLPATIKQNAGLSGRDFARAVSGVIR